MKLNKLTLQEQRSLSNGLCKQHYEMLEEMSMTLLVTRSKCNCGIAQKILLALLSRLIYVIRVSTTSMNPFLQYTYYFKTLDKSDSKDKP